MFNRTRSYLLTGIILLAVLSSCVPENSTETSAPGQPVPVTVTEESAPSPTPTSKPRELPTAVPQPTLPATTYGPDQTDFPADINPFTGLQVADPSLLEQPIDFVHGRSVHEELGDIFIHVLEYFERGTKVVIKQFAHSAGLGEVSWSFHV